jgi:hypothetical protein
MTRMKMTDHSESACTIEYTDAEDGAQWTRTFTAPAAGGYVREIFDPMKDGQQVCEKLTHAGVTLIWRPSMGHLSDLIRKEYRKEQAGARRRASA